jgi:hypothetical protein
LFDLLHEHLQVEILFPAQVKADVAPIAELIARMPDPCLISQQNRFFGWQLFAHFDVDGPSQHASSLQICEEYQ